MEKSDYKPQYTPGVSDVAKNRRKYMDPKHKLEKLRSISDESLIKLLGHREPGEAYKSVHPPLDEMGEPKCSIRKLVEPTPGAKAGDRITFIQFADSVYFSPLAPYSRCWMYMSRYRGVDPGALSGRTPLEMRERDLEVVAKELIETEVFDPARSALRGATVHGHSLRLDENGMMFDLLRRSVYDKKKQEIMCVKDQMGGPLDTPISIGKPLPEEELRKRTTIFRADGTPIRKDPELLKYVQRIHMLRTIAGHNPTKANGL